MSAHMQSKAHIDALVTAAVTMKIDGIAKTPGQRKTLVWAFNGKLVRAVADETAVENPYWCDDMTADEIGQMLYDANKTSVEERYPDDKFMVVDWDYTGYEPTRNLNLAELCMAIDGYMYQSCEADGWLASNAYAFCVALKAEALSIATYKDRDSANTWSIMEEDVRKAKSLDDALSNKDFLGDEGIVIRIV